MNPHEPHPEACLIERLKESDFEAFDVIYRKYAEMTRRFLLSLTADPSWTEDAVQEVFLRLYRMRARLEPSQSLRTLLYVIAKNLFISYNRRNKQAPQQSSLSLLENIRANPKVEPEVCLIDAYRRQCIRRAITSLPQGHLLVFILSHYEDMKYEEIANLLGIPLGTVKSRMSNAMKHLREVLKEDI